MAKDKPKTCKNVIVISITVVVFLFPSLLTVNPSSAALKKFIGTFSFPGWGVGNYYSSSWKGYIDWLKLLNGYHIHYARFWLLPWRGNINWFYCWKIKNGSKNTPPDKRIYDLLKFNESYFANLKRFVSVANKLNITLNLIVFDDCHLRHSSDKKINPEYHNIQEIRNRGEWYRKSIARNVARKFWTKVYNTLKEYPHIIYTVCNENYDFPQWQKDIAIYMAKSIVPLDTGSSKITPKTRWIYRFVSIHGQVAPQTILKHKKNEDIIFSSDGGRFTRKNYNIINECIKAAVEQGKGYELYLDSAYGWNIREVLRRIGAESIKVLKK